MDCMLPQLRVHPSSGATRHLLPEGEGLARNGPLPLGLPLGEGGSFDFAQDKLRPGEGAFAMRLICAELPQGAIGAPARPSREGTLARERE